MDEEIVIENIPAFDILDGGWEEAILFVPHVELEIEKEEPENFATRANNHGSVKNISNSFGFYNS